MSKPLVSSSFLSLPKLLTWSVPLLLLSAYTYLYGGLNVKLNALVSYVFPVAEKIMACTPILHDESFSPDFILRVTEEPFTQSCISKDEVILVNGTSPGPELRLQEGSIYWVRVYNDMAKNNVTMHWHGLSMAVAPFSDGTPGASQWPIPPNHFFDYELEIPQGYAGSYFYHSHVGMQATTCAGPLIIEDTGAPPFDYDEERLIALADVFEKTDAEIEDGLIGNPFKWSGESANILVNGKGQLAGHTEADTCSLATIDVEPDKTYRLRFLGGTALSFAMLAFEDHGPMILIEADGQYVQPVNISYLQIGSGQRFSVLFKTKPLREIVELDKSEFFLQIESRDRPTVTRSYAILSYKLPNSKRAPFPLALKPRLSLPPDKTPPLTLPSTNVGWLDQQLLSLPSAEDDFPTSDQVTRRITIRTHQIISSGSTIWAQDSTPWIETFPTEPYLVSLYKNDSVEFPSMARAHEHEGIDPVTRVFPACMGEVIEIIIQNTGSDVGSVDTHPFHAHGAHYYDLGSGNGTYDPDENEAKIRGLKLAKRDTTMLYRYAAKTTPGIDMGWRAWRLRVTEPGVWMVHCHILQHMVMGMQTVWVFGNETEIMNVPYEHIKGYLEYGGSVNGNDTHHPHVVHFKGGQ